MLPKITRVCIAALVAATLTAGTAFADESTQILLNILVKKGVLTQQDVAGLQQELAAAAAQPQAAPATVAPASNTGVPPYSGASGAGVAVAPSKPGSSPLSFKIGIADFTPFGFMDFTGVYRSTSTGSAIGTGFGSIPYANSSLGQMSETKFSAQNSRVGLRVDSVVADTKVLGYLETDFLGNAPANLYVTSNADTLRMRNYFVDLKKGQWEFLAGQDWSMLVPNRVGISPIPSDIFFTNNMDTNYQAGLTWARQPQIRVVYHATDELTLGLSLENPDQYVGGAVVLPSAFTETEVDTGAATTQPNVFPDVIAKAAFDTKAINDLPWHFELSGLLSSYKINTYSSAINTDATAQGAGIQGAVNFELVKGLHFIGTGFYSYGGGRYLFGLGPDFIVKAPDSTGAYGIGLVKATSAILGLEWTVAPVDTVSAYWSTIGFGERANKLSNGTWVGYGFPTSANSNNKTIDEFTLANTFTFWKNPQYGALQFISQVSYLDRKPWYVPAGGLNKANATMVFVDLRYVLP